jgi:hemolysin III
MSIADLLVAEEHELVEHYPNSAEHAADSFVHAFGMTLALIGGGVLFTIALLNGGEGLATAVALYAMCVLVMLACSGLYNLTRPSPARRILRRLDEAAIFLMIAGSYTPFVIKLWPHYWDLAATAFIWICAFAGAAGKVLVPQLSDKFWCGVYLGFGWLAVVVIGPAAFNMPVVALGLLIACGVTYSGGVLVYLNHKLPFRRAVWHGFVVAAAALHYSAVFLTVTPGA